MEGDLGCLRASGPCTLVKFSTSLKRKPVRKLSSIFLVCPSSRQSEFCNEAWNRFLMSCFLQALRVSARTHCEQILKQVDVFLVLRWWKKSEGVATPPLLIPSSVVLSPWQYSLMLPFFLSVIRAVPSCHFTGLWVARVAHSNLRKTNEVNIKSWRPSPQRQNNARNLIQSGEKLQDTAKTIATTA